MPRILRLDPKLSELDSQLIRREIDLQSPAKLLHIVGPYNSGTNFVAALLLRNGIPTTDLHRDLLRTAAFKHYPYPVAARAMAAGGADPKSATFVVLLRDPFNWISALKRSPYEFIFDNLSSPAHIDVDAALIDGATYGTWLNAVMSRAEIEAAFGFRSVVKYWSEYYSGYIAAHIRGEIHAVFVRYEDVVSETVEFIRIAGAIVDQPMPTEVVVPVASAKAHGTTAGYLAARGKIDRPPDLRIGELFQVRKQIDRSLFRFAGYPSLPEISRPIFLQRNPSRGHQR